MIGVARTTGSGIGRCAAAIAGIALVGQLAGAVVTPGAHADTRSGGAATVTSAPLVSEAPCRATVAAFSPGRMDVRTLTAKAPVSVQTETSHALAIERPDVVAIPQASYFNIGRMTSAIDVLLARRGSTIGTSTVYLEPPTPPSDAPVPATALAEVRQVVVSTQRGAPDPAAAPRTVLTPDKRGFSSYSLEAGRLVRRPSGTSSTSNGWLRGFGDLRAMTLISRTPRHDVLLANARDGRLYTITIPATRAFTPKRTLVRGSGWGGLDRLIAAPCGRNGTVVMGFDTRLQAAWLYQVGFARGTATPIARIGRVPGSWVGARTAPVVRVHDAFVGGERIEGG